MKNWKEGFKRSEQGTMVSYSPGAVASIRQELSRATMDASVSSFYEDVMSKRTGRITSTVTNYQAYTKYATASRHLDRRGLVLGSNAGLASSIDKKVMSRTSAMIDKTDVGFDCYIYDEVTPVIMDTEVWAGKVMGQQMADALKKGITYGVKKKYSNRNNGSWADNSLPWKTYKKKNNYSAKPMHMRDNNWNPGLGTVPNTPALAHTMKNFGDQIQVIQTGPNNYQITGLDEEFFNNQYVWFHETGYDVKGLFEGSVVPARPFIAPGVNEAMAYASGLVLNRNPLTMPKRSAISYSTGGVGKSNIGLPGAVAMSQFKTQSKKNMQDFLMFIWWFMPQISEYQYLAYVHDAVGYMSGHFITGETIKHFAKSLVAGKVGVMTGVPMTTKLARRTSRKALWGADTISITGSA